MNTQATNGQLVTYTVSKGKRIVEQGTATVTEYERIRRVWTMSLGANRSRYTVTCQPA